MSDDYWREHAEIALNEAGISGATDDQLEAIAGVIESAHEFYGQMHGHEIASANFYAEEKRQQAARVAAVEAEMDKALEARDQVEKRLRESILHEQVARERLAVKLRQAEFGR